MDIFSKNHIDFEQVKKSKRWYDTQIAAMGRVTPGQVLNSGPQTAKIVPGSLYFFRYDPKFKDTLPYYDTFPMVFPYKPVPGGILALNLHYLSYPERIVILRGLVAINGSKLDKNTKIRQSWGFLSGAAAQLSERCIKMYLYDHIQSPFAKVDPTDWTTAMFLPVERFVGASKEHVWSRNK